MPRVKGLRWWMIGLVTIGTVLNYLARSTLSVAAPTLKAQFHMTTEDYSLVVLPFKARYTVMQTVAGVTLCCPTPSVSWVSRVRFPGGPLAYMR